MGGAFAPPNYSTYVIYPLLRLQLINNDEAPT